MINDLTKLFHQLQEAQNMGELTMDDGEPTVEVSRSWWEAMMVAVHDAIDLLGPIDEADAKPEETDEEFIDRMIRENSVHPRPEHEGEHTR